MRVAALLIGLLVAGCLSGGGLSVDVSNHSDEPLALAVEITDAASREVVFSRDFGTIAPGGSDSAELDIDRERNHVANVTVIASNGTISSGSQRLTSLPSGAVVVVSVGRDHTISVNVLVAE